jgi:hypothetical protein
LDIKRIGRALIVGNVMSVMLPLLPRASIWAYGQQFRQNRKQNWVAAWQRKGLLIAHLDDLALQKLAQAKCLQWVINSHRSAREIV